MSWDNLEIEALKLCFQFAGALYIARQAVRWALNRYKDEKHWERRLVAYTDVVSALTNMLEVLQFWLAEYLADENNSNDDKLQARKYRASREKIDDARATSKLLLPKSINEILDELITKLAEIPADYKEGIEEITEEIPIIKDCRERIVTFGRKDLALKLDY